MITINVLPAAARQAAARSQLLDLPWRRIGLWTLGCLAAYSGWVLGWNQWQAWAAHRAAAEWDALQADRARVEQIQTTLTTLRGRAVALQRLKESSGQWAPRLNLLSDALVSGLWLTEARFGVLKPPDDQPQDPTQAPAPPTTPVLWVAGSALVRAAGEDAPVKRYLQRLQEQPEFPRWFLGVELKGIEHRQVGEEAVSDFGLVLTPTGTGAS